MNWIKSFLKSLNARPGPQAYVKTISGSSRLVPNSSDETMSNFTPRAQQVLALARQEAARFRHNFVGTEHLLLGIVALEQGTAVTVLETMGIDLKSVRDEVEKSVGTGPDEVVHPMVPYTPRVKKVLAFAAKEAKALNHTYVGTEHILLGLLREGDGVAGRVLVSLGLDVEKTRLEILKELDPNHVSVGTCGTASSASDSGISKKQTAANIRIGLELGAPVDTSKRYDVHCTDWSQGVTVYTNVRFKSVKQLMQKTQSESYFGFIELEQSDGRSVFVSRSSIIRFSESSETSGER